MATNTETRPPPQIQQLLQLGGPTLVPGGAGGKGPGVVDRRPRAARRMAGKIDVETAQKLQNLERHLRKNKLRLNFTGTPTSRFLIGFQVCRSSEF